MKETAAASVAATSAIAAAAAAAAEPVTENTVSTALADPVITLAEICKEIGIKPQSARVKLRRQLGEGRTKEVGFRWVFPLADKDKVIEMLKKAETAPTADSAPATDDSAPAADGAEPVTEPLPAE